MSHRTLRALFDREAREGDLSESAKAIVERALDNRRFANADFISFDKAQTKMSRPVDGF